MSRIEKARGAFNKLVKTWRSGQLSKNTKIRCFKSNFLAVLLYGCHTWGMTTIDEAKLYTFLHQCLRRLLKVHWPMRVTNEEVRRRELHVSMVWSDYVRKRTAYYPWSSGHGQPFLLNRPHQPGIAIKRPRTFPGRTDTNDGRFIIQKSTVFFRCTTFSRHTNRYTLMLHIERYVMDCALGLPVLELLFLRGKL